MPSDVYVAGARMSSFKKSTDSLEELMAEAGRKALESARDIPFDSLYIGAMNVEEFVGEANFAVLLAEYLGLSGIAASRVEAACSTGATVFESAFYAVAFGYMKNVLVIAVERWSRDGGVSMSRRFRWGCPTGDQDSRKRWERWRLTGPSMLRLRGSHRPTLWLSSGSRGEKCPGQVSEACGKGPAQNRPKGSREETRQFHPF